MELMVLSSESSREGPVVVPENVTVTLGAVLPKAFEKLLQDKAWQNMAPKVNTVVNLAVTFYCFDETCIFLFIHISFLICNLVQVV